MTSSPKLLLGCFLREENSDFLGWLAYHRAIGASHVHVFTDRAATTPRPLLDALSTAGAITLHPTGTDPDDAQDEQVAAMRMAALEIGEPRGYGLYLACDEYFRINGRAKTVQSLMRACGGADVLRAPVQVCDPGNRATDAPANGSLRSVVRLGLLSEPTPERPTGPAPNGAPTWVNGTVATDATKATILKLRVADLPEDQRHGATTLAARPDAQATTTEAAPGLAAWADATARETQALLALPGVAGAQADLCTRELARLDALSTEHSDAARPLSGAKDDGAASAEIPETPPATCILPAWFAEIHTGGDREGFYTRLENHAVACIRRDDARLVVTFDNLSNVNDLSPDREPWAYSFVREMGCSHLTVMARRKDWYRDPQLIAYLEKLSADGFFRQFGKVFMTGTSMGGFAALAFAPLAPGATVISFSPQTTLDETLVPWENRFRMGRRCDWSLPYGDCALGIGDIDTAFVFYDPFFAPDRHHIDRLEGDNVIRLKTWCSGHFSPAFLRRAKLLKPVMQHALDGTLTPALFYAMFRDRRFLPWYRKSLESNLTERGRTALAKRVTPAFRKLKRQAR